MSTEIPPTDFTNYGIIKGQMHFFNLLETPGHRITWEDAARLEQRAKEAEKAKAALNNVTLDELLDAFPIPKRIIPEGAEIVMELGFGYPAGKTLLLKDSFSGLVVGDIFYEANENFDDAGLPVRERFKPSELTHFKYGTVDLRHPILGTKVPAVSILTVLWDMDTKYRRIARKRVDLQFYMYDPGTQTGINQIQNARTHIATYEFKVDEDAPVGTPLAMTEQSRVYFFANGHAIYNVDAGGEFKLAERPLFGTSKWGGQFLDPEAEMPEKLAETPLTITV